MPGLPKGYRHERGLCNLGRGDGFPRGGEGAPRHAQGPRVADDHSGERGTAEIYFGQRQFRHRLRMRAGVQRLNQGERDPAVAETSRSPSQAGWQNHARRPPDGQKDRHRMGGGKGDIPVAQPKGVALFTGESAPSASGKGGIDRSQHLAAEGVELHFEEPMRCLQRKFPLQRASAKGA